MKKITLLLMVLICHFTLSAQITDFTMSVDETHETCTGNGKITINITNTQAGAKFAFALYLQSDVSTPIKTANNISATGNTLQYEFITLNAGAYVVKAVQTFNTETNEKEKNSTLFNNIKTIKLRNTPFFYKYACEGFRIVPNPFLGNAEIEEIALYSEDGNTEIVPFQVGKSVLLPKTQHVGGNKYLVKMKDKCGQIVTHTTKSIVQYEEDIVDEIRVGYVRKKSCQEAVYISIINLKHSLKYFDFDDDFSPTIQVQMTDLSTGTVYLSATAPIEMFSSFNGEKIAITIPTSLLDKQVETKYFINYCNKTIEYTNNYGFDLGYSTLTSLSSKSSCDILRLSLGRQHVGDVQITFTKYPTGFKPWLYNDQFVQNSYTAMHHIIPYGNPGFSSLQIMYFSSINSMIPNGTYEVELESCNGIVEKVSYEKEPQELSGDVKVFSNCEFSTDKVNYLFILRNSPVVEEAIIIDAPAKYQQEHSLPHNISSSIVDAYSNTSKNGIYQYDMPLGSYTVRVKSKCGVISDLQFTLTQRKEILENSLDVAIDCSVFTIEKTEDINDYNYGGYLYLQKYYPDKNDWGHVFNSDSLLTTCKLNRNAMLDISTSIFYNRFVLNNNSGKFRIIKKGKIFLNGKKPCDNFQIVKEFDTASLIELKNYYAIRCQDGTYSLLINASGEELKYKIVKKNNVAITNSVEQTSPVFSGLETAIYTVEIKDKCGNTKLFEFSTFHTKLPVIVGENICQNPTSNNSRLYIEGVDFMNVTWYKDDVATGVVGSEYALGNFDASKYGVYKAVLTHPNLNAGCNNFEITINLSSSYFNKNAGTSASYDVFSNNFNLPYVGTNTLFDLFTLLQGEEEGGVWYKVEGSTETEISSMVDFNTLPLGENVFKYTLLAGCDNENSSTITINKREPDPLWYGVVSTNWNVASNWIPTQVPIKGADVEFATADNNNGNPAVNNLVVDGTRTIGKLINLSDKNLIIPVGKSLTINGTITGSETIDKADKIQVQSSENKPNGSLKISCANNPNPVFATVEMYSKASKEAPTTWVDNLTNSPTNGQTFTSSYHWQFFGVPVESVVASPTFNGSFVREYRESRNSLKQFYEKWKPLTDNDNLTAFKGYEVTREENKTYVFKGALNFCNKVLNLTRRAPIVVGSNDTRYGLGQNVFGNSFTTALDVANIEFPASDILDKTVYLYNTGSFTLWGLRIDNHIGGGQTNEGVQVAGEYTAIPVNTGTAIYGGRIPSMNNFLLRFTKENTVYSTDLTPVTLNYDDGGKPNTHLQTVKQQELSFLNVQLRSETTFDNLWLFSQEGTTEGFDNGWDGLKFFGTPTAFIYSSTKDGAMQVNTSETLNNKIITFCANEDSEYRLTLIKNNLSAYQNLTLLDLKLKKPIRLTSDTTVYSFMGSKLDVLKERFKIVDADNIEDELFSSIPRLYGSYTTNEIIAINKFDDGYIKILDTSGRLLSNDKLQVGYNSYPVTLKQGVYIVHLMAGNHKYNFRIVVK